MAQCAYTKGEGKGVRCTAESTHGWNGQDYCRAHMLYLMATSTNPRGGATAPRGGATEPRGGVEQPPSDEERAQ